MSLFSHRRIFFVVFFFFQAEDGIRDLTVTGVQTCALPIYLVARLASALGCKMADLLPDEDPPDEAAALRGRARTLFEERSEERRVGKECRSRWWPDH